MATKVEEGLQEVTVALAKVQPAFDGMTDYHCAPLMDEADREVLEATADFKRRLEAMEAYQKAAKALLDDGYPALEIRPIAQAALASLQKGLDARAAALAMFSSNQASAMTISAKSPEPKA